MGNEVYHTVRGIPNLLDKFKNEESADRLILHTWTLVADADVFTRMEMEDTIYFLYSVQACVRSACVRDVFTLQDRRYRLGYIRTIYSTAQIKNFLLGCQHRRAICIVSDGPEK
jgi:hypothetical protein